MFPNVNVPSFKNVDIITILKSLSIITRNEFNIGQYITYLNIQMS